MRKYLDDSKIVRESLIYKEVVETNLFCEEEKHPLGPGPQYRILSLIGTSYLFCLSSGYKDKKIRGYWRTDSIIVKQLTFEEVFENVSDNIKEKLLYYLDLFG